jgi:hypothetical protein
MVMVSMLLAGCAGKQPATMSGPGAGGAGDPAGAGGAGAAGGAGGAGDPWHAEVESEARALSSHKDVQQTCGHDVEIRFDWATYHAVDFKPGAEGHRTPAACGEDVLKGLWLRCDDAATKQKGAAIQTVTCHYKPCKEVRTTVDVASGSTPTDEGLAEFKYELDGTNINVYHCASSSVFTQNSANIWLQKHL